jgi:Fe-Mn family superoxide dismutase
MNVDRRGFLIGTALGAAALSSPAIAAEPPAAPAPAGSGPFTLPNLPWDQGALAPVISSSTIGFHYGKHHKGYVDNLNKLVTGTPLEGLRLEDIVRETAGKPERTAIFNNAAQDWNHTFYWNSLAPGGGGKPGTEVSGRIESAFGSFEEFRKAFLAASTSQFGSGWVWLVLERASKRLAILKTGNAETPISGTIAQPLAVLDVWEHAYYLDYQNRRIDYATAVFDKLLDWNFVERNLGSA